MTDTLKVTGFLTLTLTGATADQTVTLKRGWDGDEWDESDHVVTAAGGFAAINLLTEKVAGDPFCRTFYVEAWHNGRKSATTFSNSICESPVPVGPCN